MYYRIAIQKNPTRTWQWRSTPLSSLNSLFQILRMYRTLPQAHLRVFSCPSHECLDEKLEQENAGLESNSVTAEQFLRERLLCLAGVVQGTSERREHETQENQETSSIAVATISSLNDSNRQANSLNENSLNSLERRRLELEGGVGGDHDIPYTFTLPTCIRQALAWTKLLVKVRDGELLP